MSKLDRLQTSFWQRFSVLKSSNVSVFLFAEQVAKYEIFCIVLKRFIINGNEQSVTSLLEAIEAQQDDFLLQVIGLVHLATPYRTTITVPTKTDLAVLAHYLLANYEGILVLEKGKENVIRFVDHIPHLDAYYKHKHWFDQDLVSHMGSLLVSRKERPSLDLKAPNTFSISARMAPAEEMRCTMAKQYMGAFEARFNSESETPNEDELHAILDRQIREADLELQQLWLLAKPKLQALCSKFPRSSKAKSHKSPAKSPCQSPHALMAGSLPTGKSTGSKKMLPRSTAANSSAKNSKPSEGFKGETTAPAVIPSKTKNDNL